jgi:hypothetical protein
MSSDTEVDDLVLEHLRGIRGDIAKLGLKIDLLEGRLAGVEARAVSRRA